MDAQALRAQFPVLEHVAYLNSGTDGPLPAAAVAAAREELDDAERGGRVTAHFERRAELQDELRAAYARLLGAAADDVALTTSTSDGLGRVIAGLGLGPGDEIVTSDQEHPGLVGPLLAARRRGVTVRAAPLAHVTDAVGPDTTLVALSHVSWIGGEVAPAALSELDVPVILDGAQGAGAIHVDPPALGCVAYAAAGQKWLCGADGTGFLWIDPAFAEKVALVSPGYVAFADASAGLEGSFKETAARFDTPALAREGLALSAAAMRVLEGAGWEQLSGRAVAQARRLAELLRESGRAVMPRGATTLVAWEDPYAEQTRDRLAAAGVVVRNLPRRALLRASVGAWNEDSDLDRLLSAL
ncbi:MAG TPA: aminotransferase class V-fold PLP-dependent enzyme [Solirubrobacteraceae bacterium]|nr:aminotransferase class V-fold PLP-dependent enzyme [Solirubrobacteraceae bacterium]